jgi:RimJ/RimL family protein N-acetyltransferase
MALEQTVAADELFGKGLRLRPWQLQDAEPLFDAAQSSLSTVGRWLPWCHASYALEDARAWIACCEHGWSHAEHFAFAVFDDGSGELLGAVGLNQRNLKHRSANLGYWVRQSRQGEGIAARAASLVARFGFERLGLIRIEIVTLPDNGASRRTAEKIGAKLETLARHRLWVQEQPMDAVVYALIRADMT